MGVLNDWKAAKTAFEKATGKKKPSAKFLGVFHKSGLEDTAADLDAALAKGTKKDLDVALLALAKSVSSYRQVLEKAAKEDSGSGDYAAELKKLRAAIDAITQQADAAVARRSQELAGAAGQAAGQKAVDGATASVKEINKILEPFIRDRAMLGDLLGAADAALRQAMAFKQANKPKEAKAEGSKVWNAAKTANQILKRMGDPIARADKVFNAADAKFREYAGSEKKVRALLDDMSAKVDQARYVLENGAAGTVNQIDQLVKQAEAAVSGALDFANAFADSVGRLLDRAIADSGEYEAYARTVGGEADDAFLQSVNAKDAKDAAAREAAVEIVRDRADKVHKSLPGLLAGARKAGAEIKKARDALPEAVRKTHANEIAEIDRGVQSLTESIGEFEKAVKKTQSAEAAIAKL